MKFSRFILVLFLSQIIIFSHAQVSTSLDATVRDISEVNIGFNRRSDQGTWWTDNSFVNLISEMNPDVVRYPAGTQANYWDWSTGLFIPNTDKVWGNKEIVTIPTFTNALPNRTKVVYVVNMARPTPATGVDVNASEEILKSDATLDLKIQDMIAALNEFNAQGKTVYAVELGNEFYFGNIESGVYQIIEDNGIFYSGWNPNTNAPYQSASKQDATEITALFYLEHAKAVVTQIKAVYPNIKFVLTTTKSGNGNSARDRWNSVIFDNLENNPEFASLQQDIHAVTQHHYLNDSYGVQTVITDNTSAKVAIAEGIQYPVDKQSDYDLVPTDYKIWYTEYGEVKGIAEETWASGLRYATLVYSWLDRGDKVEQLDYHYISDNNVVQVGSPMKLAPIGISQKLLAQAIVNMEEMQKINFGTNPISVNGVESLFGYKFKSAEKETVFIININDTDFSSLDLSTLFIYTGTQYLSQYYSLMPYVSGIAEGDSNISIENSIINDSFNARGFSISVIEVNNVLNNDDFEESFNVKLFPNPTKTNITIQTEEVINAVSIYNVEGKQLNRIKIKQDNLIDVRKLSKGLYILKIETQAGSIIKRFIKTSN